MNYNKSLKVNIQLPDKSFIKRVPKIIRCGNFMQLVVRYNNNEYLIGDGDEYVRGMPINFQLGKMIK